MTASPGVASVVTTAPLRVSAATRAASACLGWSRAESVSKTTRPVGLSDDVGEGLRVGDLPQVSALPKVGGGCLALSGAVNGAGVGEGLHPSGTRISGILPGDLGNLGPERFRPHEAVELKRLLGVPRLRHMGGQGADDATGGPSPRSARIYHRHLRAAPVQAQAMDRPKMPAPWMTMCIATPACLEEGRAHISASPT
jgi:hypothetical protein